MTKWELEQWMRENGKDVLRFCRVITNSSQESDELFQDTMLTFVEQNRDKKWGTSTEVSKNYCLGIAVHLWKNRKKKIARRNRIAPSDSLEMMEEAEIPLQICAGDSYEPEAIYLQKVQSEEVQHMASLLPSKQQIVITLFYTSELSVQEIAEILHIPEGTVKSRLHKGKENLKRKLEVAGYDR